MACCFYLTTLLVPSGAFAEFAIREAVDARDPAGYQLAEMAWRDDRLFTVGERGLIAYSDDNGKTWQQAKVPVSATLTAITFTDSGDGWVVGHGGTILRSNDSG
ncbi:MAG: YCF48-related protein, partial [Halieaceae bacterium]